MLIGIISGTILAVTMELVEMITGNPAAILLYNIDYIPFFKQWDHILGAGVLFHFLTCITSVLVLYFCLKYVKMEKRMAPYIIVYTVGGGFLYFLSALTDTPPAYDNASAWLYWTAGHALFAVSVGYMINKCKLDK